MENFREYQPLIGALMALLAAFIGFSGVIYSQRRLAKLAEDGRTHQERISKEQSELQRRMERESFLNAVQGELSALQLSINNAMKILLAQISIAEELARLATARKPSRVWSSALPHRCLTVTLQGWVS